MPTGIRFPVELPPPKRDGYSTSFEETRTRHEKEIGSPRQRRAFTIEPRIESVSWLFSQSQFYIFDLWWQTVIGSGLKQFDIQLSDDLGGLTWYTAQWLGEYTASIDSERYEWTVSAKLRLLGDSFSDRQSGTDDLKGLSRLNIYATGYLVVNRPLYGKASLGITATGKFNEGSLKGLTTLGVTAKANMGPVILRGISNLTITATGNGTTFGEVSGLLGRVWMRKTMWSNGKASSINSHIIAVQRSYMRLR